MGGSASGRQSDGIYRPLVAFDFDGTLTSEDSFLTFLAWRAGRAKYMAGMAALTGAGFGYMLDRDRGRLKAAAVRQFLAGASVEELVKEAEAFATDRGRGLLRPDAMRAWRRWQGESARLVVVTASPEIVVAPIVHALGADLLLGTKLAVDGAGKLTGALDGPNCRGAEKVRRLKEAFGEDVKLEAAYGDSDGDKEMLALAEEQGLKVFNGVSKKVSL